MTLHFTFDTAEIDSALLDAGLEKGHAAAIRTSIVRAMSATVEHFVAKDESARMETRIELAIAKMNADLQKQLNDLTWKLLGGVALIITVVNGVFALAGKFH